MFDVLRTLLSGWATGPLGIFTFTFCAACIVIAVILTIRNNRNH